MWWGPRCKCWAEDMGMRGEGAPPAVPPPAIPCPCLQIAESAQLTLHC